MCISIFFSHFDDEFKTWLSEISIKNIQYQTLHFYINHFNFNVNTIKVTATQYSLTSREAIQSMFIVQCVQEANWVIAAKKKYNIGYIIETQKAG